MSEPIAFALFEFTTNLNLLGCSTGKYLPGLLASVVMWFGVGRSPDLREALQVLSSDLALCQKTPLLLVENLSKRYVIGHQASRLDAHYKTALRDVVSRELHSCFGAKRPDFARERQIVRADELEHIWALVARLGSLNAFNKR